MPEPSFYEPATGRIAPLDVTLFVDAGLSAAEVLATLKYTLDLRLQGNRAPLVFISHTHVYASSYGAAAKAPDAAARQHAIEDFVRYALTKPVVRMRPVTDVITWMRHPEPLNGVVTALPPSGGAGAGGAASAGTTGAGAPMNTGAGGVTSGGAGVSAGTSAGGAAVAITDDASAPPAAGCELGALSKGTRGDRDRDARVLRQALLLLTVTTFARRRGHSLPKKRLMSKNSTTS
jgi:hypothetical protein